MDLFMKITESQRERLNGDFIHKNATIARKTHFITVLIER